MPRKPLKATTLNKKLQGSLTVSARNRQKYYQLWTDIQIGDFAVPVQTRFCIDPETGQTWLDDGSLELFAYYVPSSGSAPRYMNRTDTDIMMSQMMISAAHFSRLVDPEEIEPIIETEIQTVYQVDWRVTLLWNFLLFPAAGMTTIILLGLFMKALGA